MTKTTGKFQSTEHHSSLIPETEQDDKLADFFAILGGGTWEAKTGLQEVKWLWETELVCPCDNSSKFDVYFPIFINILYRLIPIILTSNDVPFVILLVLL